MAAANTQAKLIQQDTKINGENLLLITTVFVRYVFKNILRGEYRSRKFNAGIFAIVAYQYSIYPEIYFTAVR